MQEKSIFFPVLIMEGKLSDYSAPLISVENLFKSYHHHPVLKGVDLQVYAHELTVIIGPSGSGKSTFLRCLNSLETFDAGKICVGDVCIERSFQHRLSERQYQRLSHDLRSCIGMVFQSYNLFPHMTVLENVCCAPMVVKKWSRADAEDLAHSLLKKVGLEKYLHFYPPQLSGGQQQRAAIARALAMSPKVMLYDEPTSALDPTLAEEVLQVMLQLNEEGMTQIVVTHRMSFARKAAHKIAYFEDGRVIEIGPPEQIFSGPRDQRTQNFLKHFLNDDRILDREAREASFNANLSVAG